MERSLNLSLPSNASYSSFISLCQTATTLYILPSVYILLFLAALPGNAISLWVFCHCISSTSPTHIYLSHLSASNLMLSLTTPFLAAYYAWGSAWLLSRPLCQLVLHGITPQLHINIYIGLIILTLVALSRFAALIQHTHASRPSTCTTLLPHRFFTCLTRTTFARRMCVVLWVVAVGAIVPVTVYYSVKEAAAGRDGDEVKGQDGGCYSSAVEIGGRLSAGFKVPLIFLFFLLYLLVLLSYTTVLRHIRSSRRSSNVSNSHRVLGRVLRNIVVIQVVLSVCFLPYHIFRPIFIYLSHHQDQPTFSPEHDSCHPLSATIELKNVLLCLAILRAATDPVMYFLLDKTFRVKILQLLWCNKSVSGSRSGTRSVSQTAGQHGHGLTLKGTVD